MNRLGVYYILSREKLEEPVFNGRITSEKCDELFKGLIDEGKAVMVAEDGAIMDP
jgi:hypothetical protein